MGEFVWLVGCLVGWLVGCLFGCLVGCLLVLKFKIHSTEAVFGALLKPLRNRLRVTGDIDIGTEIVYYQLYW